MTGSGELLAEHGEVQLLRGDSDDPARRFEIRGSIRGESPRSSFFAEDRWFDAIADYHACVICAADESVAEVLRVGFGLFAAMSDRDLAAMEPMMTDSYTFVDRRALGWPQLTRQGLLDATAAVRESPTRTLVRTIHLVTTQGSVATAGAWTENFGHWQEFEVGVWINQVIDGRNHRAELFPVEQLDVALRTFKALTGTSALDR